MTGWSLLLGIGGDGVDPEHLTVRGEVVLPVLGPPGSGRSTLLRALADLNPEVARWYPTAGTDPFGAAEGPPGVWLVDDADRADAATLHRVADLAAAGHGVVVTVSMACALSHRLPIIGPALAERRFVVLGADDPAVTSPFGVRLPVDHPSIAGRAVIVQGRGGAVVQVPDAAAAR